MEFMASGRLMVIMAILSFFSKIMGIAVSSRVNLKFDGLVKSPSAALRFNFVIAAPKGPHSSVFARLASGAFYKTIVLMTFHEIIKL